jgi:hypothetical protein
LQAHGELARVEERGRAKQENLRRRDSICHAPGGTGDLRPVPRASPPPAAARPRRMCQGRGHRLSSSRRQAVGPPTIRAEKVSRLSLASCRECFSNGWR